MTHRKSDFNQNKSYPTKPLHIGKGPDQKKPTNLLMLLLSFVAQILAAILGMVNQKKNRLNP
jgi:hypothetical protein